MKRNSHGTIAVKCPVCGKTDLYEDGDVCDICGWFHDVIQEEDPNWKNAENRMSLNQARKAFAEGRQIV